MSRWLEELNERRRVARAEVLGRWADELLPVPPVFVAELSAELWRQEKGELRVACVLTFLGWSEEAVTAALLVADGHFGPFSERHARRQAERARERVFDGYWTRHGFLDEDRTVWGELGEERWVEPFEPPISAVDARRYHDLILGLAERGPWPGRSGRTDLAVYRAVISLGVEFGRMAPACPVSTIQQRANIAGSDTVKRSFERLVESKRLRRVEEAKDHLAARYLPIWSEKGLFFEGYLGHLHGLTSTSTGITLVNEPLDQGHAAFQQRVLGRTGYELLRALIKEGPLRHGEWLALFTGSRATFNRRRKQLVEHQLVELDSESGRYRISESFPLQESLDVIAEVTGANEIDKRREERRFEGKKRFAKLRLAKLGFQTGPGATFEVIDSNTVVTSHGEVVKISDLEADAASNEHPPTSTEHGGGRPTVNRPQGPPSSS